MTIDASLVSAGAAMLGPRDAGFLTRVYGGGLQRYQDRLRAIGFTGLERVLDAGCGFGQWAVALSETCRQIVGIDNDPMRVKVASTVAARRPNLSFRVAAMTDIPFEDESFNAVFCYSAIYYTDVRRSVRELVRVLKRGGRIYICSNGSGWYLLNIVNAPNSSPDFNPRLYGLRTFLDTALYRALGRPPSATGSVVTPIRYLTRLLEKGGVRMIAAGAEGTARSEAAAPAPKPFFRGRYAGLECTSEWLGVKG